jgi:hypothetical protein
VFVGDSAGNGITTIDNNIVIGHLFGVHSVFRQVSDRGFIDNIYGVPISILTSTPVLVDSDGRLGTMAIDGPEPGWIFSPTRPASSRSPKPQASDAQFQSREGASDGHAATETNTDSHSPVQRAGCANPEGKRTV